MKPTLFEVGGLEVTSYGASKALAALVVWYLVARELKRHGRDPGLAYSLTLAGFLGASSAPSCTTWPSRAVSSRPTISVGWASLGSVDS